MKDAEREGQVNSHGSKTIAHRENEGGLPGGGGIGILRMRRFGWEVTRTHMSHGKNRKCRDSGEGKRDRVFPVTAHSGWARH